MASQSNLPAIEKLIGRENYATWQFAVKTYLEHEELLNCILGTETEAKKISKAKTKIILLIDPVNYIHVQGCTTAKEVWDSLEKTFEDSGLCRRVTLLRSLITTKLEDCGSMDAYVNQIMSTAQKLNGLKFEVADDWIGTLLLAGLPEQYAPMIMGIESSGVKITGDSIKTMLLQDTRTYSSANSAFFGSSRPPQHSTNKFSKVRCYECNKLGHKASACANRNMKKNSEGETSRKATTNGSKAKKNSAFLVAYSSGVCDRDNWYVDSAASAHYTMREDWLESQLSPEMKEIIVANNSKLSVKSSGKVKATVDCGGTTNEISINNVQLVPGISANLLSVPQLVLKGLTVTFDESGCRITDRNGEICATARMVNNLFQLNVVRGQCWLTKEVDDNKLWHHRMGHLNQRSLLKLKNGLVDGIEFKPTHNDPCIPCLEGKHARSPFPKEGSRASSLLELVHSDLCGPMENASLGGARYFLTFVDDFSRKVFVYILKSKSAVKDVFTEFKAMAENQLDKKIKIIRTDNGLEYCNNELESHLRRAGIRHQTTSTYTPQQNGVAERMNRTLEEKSRCMIFTAQLSKKFWAEAVITAAHVYNHSPTKGITVTPEEAWTGKIPDVNHFRIFGCKAMVHVPKEKRRKWDVKSKQMIFVGYCAESKAYRFFDPKTNACTKSRDVVFLENDLIPKNCFVTDNNVENRVVLDFDESSTDTVNESSDEETNQGPTETISSSNVSNPIQSSDDEYFTDEGELETTIVKPIRKSERQSKPVDRLQVGWFTAESMGDPMTVQQAMDSPDSKLWRSAMEDEFNSLQENNTWDLVDLPKGRKAIGVKWVLKTKRDTTGNVIRHKARLVVKGFSQRKGIDYDETFSPVVRQSSIRYLMSLAAQYDLEIEQMDAVSAFLQGEVNEEIYIKQPVEFRNGDKVCRLNKAMYGLKQASRQWNLKFDAALKAIGFHQSNVDPCVYYKINGKSINFVAIHVDDSMIFSNDKAVRQHLKSELSTKFKMTDLGTAEYCVGFRVTRQNGKVCLDQEKHIRELLAKFDMNDCKPVSTPADPNQKLTKDMAPKTADQMDEMTAVPYQEAVGGLLYIAQGTRPDIAYAVNCVSKFNNNPGKAHWTAVKRIMRYLKGTITAKLEYSKDDSREVTGYCDADWANDCDDRRSTTGYCFVRQNGAISWSSKRQKTIALSTTEAEYMSLSSITQEAVWLRQLLNEFNLDGHSSMKPTRIYCDNMSAIDLSKSVGYHGRTKHIDIRHHFVRQHISLGHMNVQHISTDDMVADILTKPLFKPKHLKFANGLGIRF